MTHEPKIPGTDSWQAGCRLFPTTSSIDEDRLQSASWLHITGR
ncbi:hypothetical protein [[Mycobacterium] appelbergii]|nr:hypothetical protein [Mycobacterium sp. 21AC1]